MSNIWPTYTEEAFRTNPKAQGSLFELLQDPVMQEALLIIQSKLNVSLPSTVEAAALAGAYAAGAQAVISGLHRLAQPMESTEAPVAMEPVATVERNAWINSLKSII